MKHIKKFIALIITLCTLRSLAVFSACNSDTNTKQDGDSSSIELETNSDALNGNSFPTSSNAFPENSSVSDSSSIDTNAQESVENSKDSSFENSSDNSAETPTEKPVTTPVALEAQYIRCTGDNVNIRSGAGTDYSILGSAEEGTIYALIEKKGSWYKTYYRNKVAYIYAKYAQVVTLEKSKNTNAEEVISEGYKLLGTPYVYGAVRFHDGNGKLLAGFSAQKFDCSSLIQYIFYQGANKIIGSHTRAQVKQGAYVNPNELKRGDCLFFTNEERQYNTGIERVGHVALYLGNNYILHTASDYARIEKITASRWKFFIEARRFV